MKTAFYFLVILVITPSFIAQNIVEALQLKDKTIKKHFEGELSSTDTLIDIKNGYYEEYNKDYKVLTTLRQAAIFNNQDGSKTLGISNSQWDFQCFTYNSSFYSIIEKDKIERIDNSNILPKLDIIDFVGNGEIIPTLEKYLPLLQENYLGDNDSMEVLLSEIYDIKYLIPRKGTALIATLAVCDYIPSNEIKIIEKDWFIIMNDFSIICLDYDKTIKKFKRKNL